MYNVFILFFLVLKIVIHVEIKIVINDIFF